MARPGGRRVAEKPKNFFQSLKRIIKDLNKWNYIMALALTLAMISAILSLIAPNKLSNLADEIRKGLVPKTEKIELIIKEINKSFTEENLLSKTEQINTSKDLTQSDRITYYNTIQYLKNTSNKEEIGLLLMTLPDKILEIILNDIEIDKTIINAENQIEMIKISKNLYEATNEE